MWSSILIIVLSGCYAPQSWEDIESNNESVLNVFGLISLDPNVKSFVRVYRSTDLEELSEVFVSTDSIYYDEEYDFWWVDSVYEPAAIIKYAQVIISTDEESFEFHYVPKDYSWETDKNAYQDRNAVFTPHPNSIYNLTVIAPGFETVTGQLTTPGIPAFIDSMIQDSISRERPYEIVWEIQENTKGYLIGTITGQDEYGFDDVKYDMCGSWFERVVDLDEGLYTLPPAFCMDEGETFPSQPFLLRLVAMDENYYQYFIVGETSEYANMFLDGNTTGGRSVGIEGGLGLFGSIASCSLSRVFVPR